MTSPPAKAGRFFAFYWREVVEAPFYQYATDEQLVRALQALCEMVESPAVAATLNMQSLEHRQSP